MMKSGSDGRMLSESELAVIAGVKRPRRAGWAKQGYLRVAGSRGKYGELDAVELAAFAALVDTLGFDDATMAWVDVREALRENALADTIFVVFDHQAKSAFLVRDRGEIGARLEPGRLFELVDVGTRVTQCRNAYRKIRATRDARTAPAGSARPRERRTERQ